MKMVLSNPRIFACFSDSLLSKNAGKSITLRKREGERERGKEGKRNKGREEDRASGWMDKRMNSTRQWRTLGGGGGGGATAPPQKISKN